MLSVNFVRFFAGYFTLLKKRTFFEIEIETEIICAFLDADFQFQKTHLRILRRAS